MADYINRVREILKIDFEVPRLSNSYPEYLTQALSYAKQHPEIKYFSEWNDNLMGNRLFIKLHGEPNGRYLKSLIEDQKPVKKPNLVLVGTIDDLKIMRQAA